MPIALTLRRAVLLYAVMHGDPPWMQPGIGKNRLDHASELKSGSWVMCCGHSFSADEINQMVDAGWIRIDEKRDNFGRRMTTAGPKIRDAWQYPHYPISAWRYDKKREQAGAA